MKFSELALVVLFTLYHAKNGRTDCVLSRGKYEAIECKHKGDGKWTFEGKRWTLPKGHTCNINDEVTSPEMAICCTSERDYEVYDNNEQAKSKYRICTNFNLH